MGLWLLVVAKLIDLGGPELFLSDGLGVSPRPNQRHLVGVVYGRGTPVGSGSGAGVVKLEASPVTEAVQEGFDSPAPGQNQKEVRR
jgi:hypothetical protein